MFDKENKRPAKPGPLKRGGTYKEISGTVLISCYVASAAIAVIAGNEAFRSFGSGSAGNGTFYVILAVLGVLFSVFITVMNNRNKKMLRQGKIKKGK